MGITVLWITILTEACLAVWAFAAKKPHTREKAFVRLAGAAALAGILAAGGAGLDMYGIFIAVLLLQAAAGFIVYYFKKEKPFRPGRQAGRLLGSVLLCAVCLFPAILFPACELPAPTGSFEVETAEYTWTDPDRVETYTDTGENRTVTVKFWYPAKAGSYPLVVFSHGAFGVIDSNYSTCADLASNGYVAVSIGHTYHAMYVKDVNGRITMGDMDFVRQVYATNGADDTEGADRVFRLSRQWMEIRTGDENFVLDTILKKAENKEEGPFALIDAEKIGLFGHSLGGAASVQVGRERSDISAVIDLEGTMFGEYLAFENGGYVYNEEPYPVPLLDVNSRSAYEQVLTLPGKGYVNFYVGSRAECFHEAVFNGAGHLNFTDLPMVSPPLAKLLGVGETDARACMENVNQMVLAFFDSYLKGKGAPEIRAVYE